MNQRILFDQLGDRRNSGNMKWYITPNQLKEKGYISFAGAEMDFKTAPIIRECLREWVDKGMYTFTLKDECYCTAIKQIGRAHV